MRVVLFSFNIKFVIAAVCGIAVIIIAKKLISLIATRKSKRDELSKASADKQRDENLNSRILNEYMRPDESCEILTPYDVDYGGGFSSKDGKKNQPAGGDDSGIMIRVVEQSELSSRKFMLNALKDIRIGSDMYDNDISVQGMGVEPFHCIIFSVNNQIYVKNASANAKTIIRRKKDSAIVGENPIKLKSEDIIEAGAVRYSVTFV